MTTQPGDRIELAERISWQRQATILLAELLKLAAEQHLPAINWTVVNAGATLHGECIACPHPLRREWFTAWRDAITAVTSTGRDTDSEHNFRSGETRLLALWKQVPIDLDPRWRDPRPGRRAPSVRVVLTASIWPDAENEEEPATAPIPKPKFARGPQVSL
jgi:hypothetical protein